MAVEELKARLSIDVSPFEAGCKRTKEQLEDLERRVKQTSSGVQELDRAIGTRLVGAFKALGPALAVAGVVAFGAALKWGVAEITEAERAVMKLTAVFDGQAAAVGRMTALAETLAGKTLFFEDDQIQAAIATFKLFDVGEKEIQKLLPAVMDMATVMGMDLDQAVQKVSLGLSGQTRGLKQWGIIVQEGASAQDVMNAVLAKAAGFHDQAAQAGDTLTGKLAGLKKATHDAAESMANALKPTLETIVIGFTDAALAAKGFFDQLAVNREGLYMGSAGAKKVALPGLEGAAGATPLPAGAVAAAAAGFAAMQAGKGLVIPGEAPPSSSLPQPRGGAGTGAKTGAAAGTGALAAAGPGGIDVLAGDLANLFKRFDTAKQRYHDILVAAGEAAAETRAAFAGQLAAAMAPPDLPDVAPDFAKIEQAREAAAQRMLSADAERRQIAIGLTKEGFERERALVEQWFHDESGLYQEQSDTITSLKELRVAKLAEIGRREVAQAEQDAIQQIKVVGQAAQTITGIIQQGRAGNGLGVAGAMLSFGGTVAGGIPGAVMGAAGAAMPLVNEVAGMALEPTLKAALGNLFGPSRGEQQLRQTIEERERTGELSPARAAFYRRLDTSSAKLELASDDQRAAAAAQMEAADRQKAAAAALQAAAAGRVAEATSADILSKIRDEGLRQRVERGEITAERGAAIEWQQTGFRSAAEDLAPMLRAEAERMVGNRAEYEAAGGDWEGAVQERTASLGREAGLAMRGGATNVAGFSAEAWQAIQDAAKLQPIRQEAFDRELRSRVARADAADLAKTQAGTPPEDMSGRTPDRPLYVEVTNMPPANPFVFAPGSRFFRGGQDVTTRAPGGPQNVVTGSTGGRGAPASQVTGGTPIISRSGGTARSGGARR